MIYGVFLTIFNLLYIIVHACNICHEGLNSVNVEEMSKKSKNNHDFQLMLARKSPDKVSGLLVQDFRMDLTLVGIIVRNRYVISW